MTGINFFCPFYLNVYYIYNKNCITGVFMKKKNVSLLSEIRSLIESARQRVAVNINTESIKWIKPRHPNAFTQN